MESCQKHFLGALNSSPPPKKTIFFQEQEISQEREFVASQIGDYKKILLIVQTYLGGQSCYPPPFNPPNPVSSWREESASSFSPRAGYLSCMVVWLCTTKLVCLMCWCKFYFNVLLMNLHFPSVLLRIVFFSFGAVTNV